MHKVVDFSVDKDDERLEEKKWKLEQEIVTEVDSALLDAHETSLMINGKQYTLDE